MPGPRTFSARRSPLRLRSSLVLVVAAALAAGCASADVASTPIDLGPGFPAFPQDTEAETSWRPAEDAVLAVVHVRQSHLPPGLPETTPDDEAERAELAERVRRANDAQRSVHRELRRLARAGFDRVFAEGLASGWQFSDRLALSVEYVGALHRIEAALAAPRGSLVAGYLEHGAADAAAGHESPDWEAVRYAAGAELLLALSGEVRLHPAENADLLHAASEALRTSGVDGALRWSETREDAILAEVAAQGDGAAVVLLGALHDLSNNVERWNEAHPSRRMTLVVVTPR
jgi:hypothetical protein